MRLFALITVLPLSAGTIAPVGPTEAFSLRTLAISATGLPSHSLPISSLYQPPYLQPSPLLTPHHSLAWLPLMQRGEHLSADTAHRIREDQRIDSGYPEITNGAMPIASTATPTVAASEPPSWELVLLCFGIICARPFFR